MFREKTNPPGDFKERFFENVADSGDFNVIDTLRAAFEGDTYLHLPYSFGLLDELFTLVGGAMAKFLFPQKHKGMLAKSLASRKDAGH